MSKKIINGKKYDTETAKYLANYSNECSARDFRYINESLYIKKTGEFFLNGEGGAMTKYSRPVNGNATTGGSDIIPLDKNEAKNWVEKHANKLYEELFGEVIE